MHSKLFVIMILLVSSLARANSLILDATTKSLELETSTTASTDYVVSYADNTTTAFTPGMNQGNIASATTTTILAAPAASTQRQVKWLSLKNRSTTTAQTVTLKLDVSATEYHLRSAVTLSPGESLEVAADGTLNIFTASGLRKTQATDMNGYNGQIYAYQKTGTAKDAAGYWIAFGKDAGFPGAYVLGTPGLNGASFACDTAAGAVVAGAHLLPDPATGNLYLTNATLASSAAEYYQYIDVLWFNTGLAVTTTTGQAVTFSGLPARDINGSTNGEGVAAALLSTAANTNAGVITNTTLTYTDQDGNAGATATFSAIVGWQAPATPVIGTWMPFQLAAGDRGIRSVQTITLGTSYGAGSLSLILYRVLAGVPNVIANGVAGLMSGVTQVTAPGVRVYNDSCIWVLGLGSASAATLAGTYTIIER